MRIRIILVFVCLGVIAGCSRGIKKESSVKKEPSVFPVPIVRTDKASGIWILDDRKNIEEFLVLSSISCEFYRDSYLIDFRPEVGKVYIKFLYDPELYEADVETLGKYHYRLVKGNKSREFKIIDSSEGYPCYWYFEDSRPYDPKRSWSRDGDKEPDYKDLKYGIKRMQDQYERDRKEFEYIYDYISKEPSVFPDPIVRTDKVSGIWVIENAPDMENFLNLKKERREHSWYYLIDFRPETNEAYIKFIFSGKKPIEYYNDKKLYRLEVQKISANHYRLIRKRLFGKKIREIKIADTSLWNFMDSRPFTPKAEWDRDGEKESWYKDLRDGIEKLKMEMIDDTGAGRGFTNFERGLKRDEDKSSEEVIK